MSTITEHGYVLVYVGKGHHLADVRGYAYEHRLVAEKKFGRRLKKGELVHHRKTEKEERKNNDEDNLLIAASIGEHKVLHRKAGSLLRFPGEGNPLVSCECGCGATFVKYDSNGRPRKFLGGHWRKGRKGGWGNASQ